MENNVIMQNNRIPKVSICIPVYNCSDFIGATIESVLAQTYVDYELIIIDNKSTDNTVEIINGFSDKRIRFIQNETNVGMCNNWNNGLKEVKGEYVKFLPADDLLYSECLEMQVKKLDENQSLSIVTCKRDIIDHSGKKIMSRSLMPVNVDINDIQLAKRVEKAATNIIGEPCVVLFRRKLIERTGKFNPEIVYVFDIDYWLRMAEFGSLFCLDRVLCAFRVAHVSTSFKIKGSQASDFVKYLKKLALKDKYNISRLDFLIGCMKAYMNQFLRNVFYLIFIKGQK